MANPYINIYMNNPTEGGTDGTAVSTDGTYTAPVSVDLISSNNETKIVKLAIRCEPGYQTVGGATITCDPQPFEGHETWKLSTTLDDNEFADTTGIGNASNEIGSTNRIFYAKAISYSTETPTTDRSTSFRVIARIRAVEEGE